MTRIGAAACAAVVALSTGLAASSASADFKRATTVEFISFGTCALAQLGRRYPNLVRLTDLRSAGMMRISMDDATVGLFGPAPSHVLEMDITRTRRGSDVEIRSSPSFRGADYYAERTWKELSACLPPI